MLVRAQTGDRDWARGGRVLASGMNAIVIEERKTVEYQEVTYASMYEHHN